MYFPWWWWDNYINIKIVNTGSSDKNSEGLTCYMNLKLFNISVSQKCLLLLIYHLLPETQSILLSLLKVGTHIKDNTGLEDVIIISTICYSYLEQKHAHRPRHQPLRPLPHMSEILNIQKGSMRSKRNFYAGTRCREPDVLIFPFGSVSNSQTSFF